MPKDMQEPAKILEDHAKILQVLTKNCAKILQDLCTFLPRSCKIFAESLQDLK